MKTSAGDKRKIVFTSEPGLRQLKGAANRKR
jgi:hypothetical protein